MKMIRTLIVVLCLFAISGCTGITRFFAGSPGIVSLSDYLTEVAAQVAKRDQLSWLQSFVAHKNQEPFLIMGYEDEGKLKLSLKLTTSDKEILSATGKIFKTPDIGVSKGAESTAGTEANISLVVKPLDPSQHQDVYKEVTGVFAKYELKDICRQMSEQEYTGYKNANFIPGPVFYSLFDGNYYVVTKETRSKFAAMVVKLHDLK